MTPLQRRFKKIVERFGDAYTVSSTTGVGIFVPVTTGQAGTYLTSSELGAAGRPIRMAYVPYDDATSAGASIVWNTLTLSVLKAVPIRFCGTTVAKLLVVA